MEKRKFWIEWMIVAIAIVIIFFSVLCDVFDIIIFKIGLSSARFLDLVNTLFNIQASISTLGIALLALLIDSIEEKRYGVKIGKFVMTNHIKLLTHQAIIIFEILLLIVNYIFLLFNWLNASVSVFLISTFLIIFLSMDILILFSDKETVYKDILNNFNVIILENDIKKINNIFINLNNHLEELSFERKTIELQENLDSYHTLYEDGNEKTRELIETNYTEMFIRVSYIEDRYTNEVLYKSFIKILEIANSKKYKINFIDNMQNQIYDVIASLPQKYYYKEYDFPYINIYNLVLVNEKITNNGNFKEKKQTVNIARNIYPQVFKIIDWDASFRKARISGFYSYLMQLLKNNNNGEGLEEINEFTKSLIDNNDIESINNIISRTIDFETRSTNIFVNVHLLSLFIFFFYILYESETLNNDSILKESTVKILNKNQSNINEFFYHLNIESSLSNDLINSLNNQLNNWEILQHSHLEAKLLIMEKVIYIFLISVLLNKSRDSSSLNIYFEHFNFKLNNILNYIIKDESNFKLYYEEITNKFIGITLHNKEQAFQIIQESYNTLKIKEKLFISNHYEEEKFYTKAQKTLTLANEHINQKLSNFFNYDTELNNKQNVILADCFILPIEFFDYSDFMLIEISKTIESLIINELLNKFKEIINTHTFNYKDNDTLEKIMGLVEDYDSMIGKHNSFLFFNDLLVKKYEEFLTSIKILDVNVLKLTVIFLNSDSINFIINKTSIIIEKLKDDEVISNNFVNEKDELYEFNDMESDQLYRFNKDELLSLFANKYRKINIEVDIEYNFRTDERLPKICVINLEK
ncbi:hypothetical protein [Fundicoccus culcitae]|uniref:Uncharacterized protein n=1 Tax=Fundicoccus culcitae TaxID=2969821 RepID=A0ABY5P8X8_9LACT|nr:hypothetical protein [Fundicoccus culcitae]UUX35212.1 hypothetical protein NRE15_06095 [Fundicoccus culcitae]